MTAHFAKEQTVLLDSDHLSRYGETIVRPVSAIALASRFVRSAVSHLREASHRRAVLRDLNRLTDRELADVGLARDELHRVFDPGFVAARHGA